MAFTKIAAAGIGSTGTVTLERLIVTGSVDTPAITGAASTANVRANSLVVSGVSTLGNIVATTGTFSGNVSIAGTLTYEDVTNIDSIGIVTARSGVVVNTGTATTALIVNGSARITGILTIGTSSVTLDGTNNQVNVGTGVTIHHTNGVQVGGNTLHSSGLIVNSLNASGVVTASSFRGDGSALTGIAATTNVRTDSLVVSGVSTFNNYVGINTTSPATFLHISGNDISARGQLSITGANSNNARISLYTNNTFIGHLQGGTSDGILVSTESTYPIVFSPGGSERVRVGTAGSLSVGTSTPQARFHVNGSGSLQSSILTRTGYASNNAEIAGYFVTNQGYNASDSINARVGVYGYAISFNEGGAYGVYGVGYGNVGNGGGVGVYGVSGSTYSSGGASYGVRGYRTRSPSTGNGYGGYFETESSLYSTNAALGIQVNAKTSGDGDSIGAVFNDNNSGTLLACSFRRSGTQVGRIETTASATAYQTSSDYRLKENVVPLTNAIDRLKNIPVRRFNFKVEPEKTVDGFVAHEVQPFVPEAVSGVKDEVKSIYNDNGEIVDTEPVYQGIDQSKLVPLLTAALQEAVAEIETLKERLNAAGI